MYKHHASKTSITTTKGPRKNPRKFTDKEMNSLQIFVDFPYICPSIINSRYTPCFEYAHHGLFMGSLTGIKHMDLTNGVKLMHFEIFYSYVSIVDFLFKSVLDSCS